MRNEQIYPLYTHTCALYTPLLYPPIHTTKPPTRPLLLILAFRGDNTSSLAFANNWLRPTGLGSPVHHLAMKLFRSGATPGVVPTNGRWKFKPGGAKQDCGSRDPAKSSFRAIRRGMAGELCRGGRGDMADG